MHVNYLPQKPAYFPSMFVMKYMRVIPEEVVMNITIPLI